MNPPLPLLYTYRRCPYAMRARLALLAAGKGFDAHEIVLRDKPTHLLAISPKGTVPVLQLPDGTVLEQSLDIMAWALAAHEGGRWWQGTLGAPGQAWLQVLDGPFKAHLDRYKYPERFATGGQDRDAVRDHHRQAAAACLIEGREATEGLEPWLARHPWLGGAQPDATDLAVFPFVRQFAAVDAAWFQARPWPGLQGWLQRWLDSPLFAHAMARLPAQATAAFPPAP